MNRKWRACLGLAFLAGFITGTLFEHFVIHAHAVERVPECRGEAANIWVRPDEPQGRDVLGTPKERDVIVGGTRGNDFSNPPPGELRNDTPTGPDLICGRAGIDLFYGGASGCKTSFDCAERWYGDDGSDWFYGGHGPEIVFGGPGNDFAWFFHGPVIFRGGPGGDHVYTGDKTDCPSEGPCKVIYGGPGFDHVHLCLPLRMVELHSIEEVHLFKDRFDVHEEHRFSPCAHTNVGI